MSPDNHQRDDFIPYPTDRVVGTINDATNARAAIEALSQAGFRRNDIDVLHGERDLHRLDPTGAEHGFLARFQRTLIRIAAPVEEYKHLSRHVEDVRAGRFVVMVLTKQLEQRDVAAQILSAHGAEFIVFYGMLSYEALDGATDRSRVDRDVGPAGKTYEVHVGDVVTRVRVESESTAVVSDTERSPSDVGAHVTRIAPDIFMLSWQRADKVPIVEVADLAHGTAYAVLPGPGGTLRHVTGTVQRVH